MVAGFLGAQAPKQREKDREGRGEGKKKLLWTVVSFPPHINTRIGNLLQIKIEVSIRAYQGSRSARIRVCVPLGSDRLTRARRDHCPERCKTFAPSGTRPFSRAREAPSSERRETLPPSVGRSSLRVSGTGSLKKRLLTRRLKLQYHLHPYDYNQ